MIIFYAGLFHILTELTPWELEADNNYKSLSFSNTPTTVLRSVHRMWSQINPLQALSWQCALPDHNHSNAHITDRFTMEAAQFSKEISIVITVFIMTALCIY